MLKTVEAVLEPSGEVHLLEPIHVSRPSRVLLTLLETPTEPERGSAAALLQRLRDNPLPQECRRSAEEIQHRLAGGLDQPGGCMRGRVGRMGIAKDVAQQQLLVPAHLRFCVQPAAGVIEIHLVERVEAAVVAITQFIEIVGLIVAGVFRDEFRV